MGRYITYSGFPQGPLEPVRGQAMQRNLIVVVLASLFIVLPVVNGKQPSALPTPQAKDTTSVNAVVECAADSDGLHETSKIAAPAVPMRDPYFKPDGSAETVSTGYPAVNLERDLNFLVQKQ